MSALTKDDLILAQQGLKEQVEQALASLQYAQGALQCVNQLMQMLEQKESEEEQNEQQNAD
jgi:hypothetical protein